MQDYPNEGKKIVYYQTYNGLNRPAMIKGVPLMLGLAVAFIAAVGGFFAIFLWGISGFLFPATCGMLLFAVRVICENDPNALSVLNLIFSGYLLKLKHGDSIVGFSSVE